MSAGGVAPNYMRSAPIRRLRHPLDDSPAWDLAGTLLWSFLAFFLALPLLLVLAFLLPATYLLRWLMLMLYWNRRRSQSSSGGAESMRGSESRWLGGSWQRSVVHAVLVFDSPPEVNELRRLFVTRVLPVCPRLARRPLALPTVGNCWLPDSQFNIDNHVFAKPVAQESIADAQLQEYVSSLVCEGLASDKPPWELQVVGRCAVLRVHQSVADGAALVTLLCRCLADSAVKPRLQVHRHALGFYCDILRACLLGPLTLLFWLLVSSSDCNLLTSQRQTVAGSGSQGSSVKVTWSAAISFAKVTRVKQVTRSTVNCVLLSALSGALRCLLQSCGVRQPPDLKIVLPVDLRRCNSPSAGLRLGSKIAPVAMPLPVNTEGAVPRLWSTRRTLSALRRSVDPVVVYLATSILMSLLPGHFARQILSNIVENKASLQFSSQMGPPSAVAVGGCTLKSVYALLPAQSQLSVAVTVFTYNDQLSVTVATDATLGPAGSLLLHHLQAQIESLYELLKNRRAPGESKNESNLYRFPDVTRSPVREIAHRLNHVQEEVRRLSHHDTSEPERLQRLRAEFSHLLRELRKRRSNGSPDQDEDVWDKKFRSRRRSMSCSFTRRPSSTLIGLISNNRPISCIEPSTVYHTSPSGNRCQARRNTTSGTNSMSSSSSSSSTSHSMSSSNSSCNRRTSTPIFSPMVDRQILTEIKESPTRQRRGDNTKKQPFVKSYSQPSVMPHDVRKEISSSEMNLLNAAGFHSQPVFRISEESEQSPFIAPMNAYHNEQSNLRRKLLERNIYSDYNSYVTSRYSTVETGEIPRTVRKVDRNSSSRPVYSDYSTDAPKHDCDQGFQQCDIKSCAGTVCDTKRDSKINASMDDSLSETRNFSRKFSFDSELYDEILYVIKDNEQLSSIYSGFDSPRTSDRVIRTTRIDGGDQGEIKRASLSPSPTSDWNCSENDYTTSSYLRYDSCNKHCANIEQKHQLSLKETYGNSTKESYCRRYYYDQRKPVNEFEDDDHQSSSSTASSSPMRHRNRSALGKYRKLFNDEDDDVNAYEEGKDGSRHNQSVDCHMERTRNSYDNHVSFAPENFYPNHSLGASNSRMASASGHGDYRDAIDSLSDFANTVHKFGSGASSSIEGNCTVHSNPKLKSSLKATNRSSSTSSSMSSLLSSQSYRRDGYSDNRSKSRDVSPSSRTSPLIHGARSHSPLTTLHEESRLKSTLAIEDNHSDVECFGQNKRVQNREFSDQPARFLRDRQYDKALSYFVTQKINSSNLQSQSEAFHSPTSNSPSSISYSKRHTDSYQAPYFQKNSPTDLEVTESSPKYTSKNIHTPSNPHSSNSIKDAIGTTHMNRHEKPERPCPPERTTFSSSIPFLSSSSSSSNSIVSFMQIPNEDEPSNTQSGLFNSSGSANDSKKYCTPHFQTKTYSYNNEAYDNSQDKVSFI